MWVLYHFESRACYLVSDLRIVSAVTRVQDETGIAEAISGRTVDTCMEITLQ